MIRDESGGIGWSSPEIIGEIIKNNTELFSDIIPIIVSFLDEEMLCSGVLWAVGRIDKGVAGMSGYASRIIPYLKTTDKILRGLAAWSLGEIGAFDALNELEKLKDDDDSITLYIEGELREKTIGEIATGAIAKIAKVRGINKS